jgi:hypothetical protein
MSSVRIAPSWPSAIVRAVLVIAASALVSLAAFAINGAPSRARERPYRSEGPFGPTMPFGLVQFVGQTAMLAAGVYVGRRWLRLKL